MCVCYLCVCQNERFLSGYSIEEMYMFSKSFLATVLVSAFLDGKALIHPEDIQTISRNSDISLWEAVE